MPFSVEVLSVRLASVIFLSTLVGPPFAYTPAQRGETSGGLQAACIDRTAMETAPRLITHVTVLRTHQSLTL